MSEIPEEYLAKARLVISSAHPQENLAHVIARALMEAVEAERERCAKIAEDRCEKNEEYLRNAPSLLFRSGPHIAAERRRRDTMAKHAQAYRSIATAIRAGGEPA